ncbi:alpha/beta fold hydrolase [Lysobacter korlensis]|uniref:Alpha/beta fold hydrolase n=1 Tax=Lysobacter korlensis TaxID=553636 RepID=A0ABV6RUI1_9GAMM
MRTSRGEVHAMVGGSGPPVLLLHGYPQSSMMWRDAATLLAKRCTVVATDLAGYGRSFRPAPTADHRAHDKRTMGGDQLETMQALGFDRFSVAGHDRGGRVAYRMALDHPAHVARLAVLDIVPTAEVYRLNGTLFGRFYWHWSFLAQPAPLPERLIGGDRDAFFDLHVRAGMGLGATEGRYPAEIMLGYRQALDDPGLVEGMCEDYRAGAGADREADEADAAAGARIDCPVLVLWAGRGSLPRVYPDVLEVWRAWARNVRGEPIDAAHFLVEDQPEQVAARLASFVAGP